MARTRMIVWLALVWTFLVVTYPSIFRAKYYNFKSKFKKRASFANLFVLYLAKLMFYSSGSRLKITGLDNVPKDKAVVFVSNHQGHMDSVIIQGFIKKPKGFVSIKEFEKVPILGTWMKYMGSVFIDRSDSRQSLKCINEAVDNLNRGLSMVVFPEGKYNDGEDTMTFEKGWLRMAIKSGAPIVPITISNSYKILSYNGKSIGPARVECTISEPIETTGIKRKDEKDFLIELRDLIHGKIVTL
jgi:1-acyl-sn-glycerol-3-phosphate acyltransferase